MATLPGKASLMAPKPKLSPCNALFVHSKRLPLYQTRSAATTSSAPTSRRRAVTVVNDTGAVAWRDLSIGEKAARTTQQSFNVGLVLLGAAATVAVGTVLWLEVFSTDSKTAVFNRAANQIRKDAKCLELLATVEDGEIRAFGEPSWSRWARNRTVSSRVEKGRDGVEHLHMRFYVEGARAKGTVRVEMVKGVGGKEFEYRVLAVDVPGQQRHYLINENEVVGSGKKGGKMFGVRWN